jgi:ATP-binding cassette subfamily B protein
VSFTARQGEISAIVGPSGGGATITHLISRFFDVSGGSITIGGADIREIDPRALMDSVNFVFQDVYLFKQSVMDNIYMGNPSATDGEVIEAAKAAQCHEFVLKTAQDYRTVIGTKGVYLSGGEKQRIAGADSIIVLDKGRVVEQGTHDSLWRGTAFTAGSTRFRRKASAGRCEVLRQGERPERLK